MKKQFNETVTVIVPVYNRQELVGRCLDSIFSQTYRPLRLIVVDNNSTDRSLATVKDWAALHESSEFHITILSEYEKGAAAARDLGLKATDTDKVMFFDSDDILSPETVERAVDRFNAPDSPDIVYWRRKIHCLDGTVMMGKRSSEMFLMRNHLLHSVLSTQNYMVRTSFIRKAGGWGHPCMVWNDWELGIRLLLNQPVTAEIDYVGCEVFSQSDSITGESFHSRHGEWEKTTDICELKVGESDYHAKKKVISWIDYRRIILAAHYDKEGYSKLGEELKHKTFRDKHFSGLRKFILEIIYKYTALGGRGAYLLWHPFA